SGHGDYREMADYLSCQDPALLKKVFLVHGEYDTQVTYGSYLERKGFTGIEIPAQGMSYTI
ncbi:MBL fold metallo-hydrolase, partial [bacterium]|nr:MBL fold metallo-hydrolase [bacterium]